MGCYSTGFPGNGFVGGYLLSSAFGIPTPMKRKGKMPDWKGRDQKGRNPMTASVNTWKVQEPEGGFKILLNSKFTEGHAFVTRFYWPLATDRSREKLGPLACNHLELKQFLKKLKCTVEGTQGSSDRRFFHPHHTLQGHQVASGPDHLGRERDTYNVSSWKESKIVNLIPNKYLTISIRKLIFCMAIKFPTISRKECWRYLTIAYAISAYECQALTSGQHRHTFT